MKTFKDVNEHIADGGCAELEIQGEGIAFMLRLGPARGILLDHASDQTRMVDKDQFEDWPDSEVALQNALEAFGFEGEVQIRFSPLESDTACKALTEISE